MTSKNLIEVLVHQGGGVRDGDQVRLSRESDTTMFVSLGNEALTIERVTQLELRGDMVIATTHRNEQYVVAFEDIRALRIGPSGNKTGLV